MLLNISTTHKPATDLSFLLHKHPDKLQSVELSTGEAHIFYSEATNEKCSANLLLDINPIELVKNRRNNSSDFALTHYVNDRPYVASSFLSVAISKAFSTALNGKCSKRPELVDQVMDFDVKISVLPA
ncbi:MAG: 3' terminal RNA ribose 2'-O-methyltransferase Hen1, partial [Candidatus Kapaibacterium sp.]